MGCILCHSYLIHLVNLDFKRLFKVHWTVFFFFKCFSSCFSSHAAGWIPAENKFDLTGMSRCLFLFFPQRQEGGNMILGHCSSHASCGIHTPHRVPRGLHKAPSSLHPVQQIFTLPGGKKSWYCYLNSTQKTNTYRKKKININSFACYIMNIRWILSP